MAAKQKTQMVSKSKKAEVVVMSDTVPDYIKTGHRGQENVGIDDLTIPRLDVIQSLSPQRKKSDPAYIDGAEEGMLFNTVTGELYGDSVLFVPVYFRKEFIIWKNSDKGGGFNGAFPTLEEARAEFNYQEYSGEDYEIVAANNHFGLVIHDDGTVEEVVLAMAKSKSKISRKLNTLVKMAGGDRFSRVYKVSAVPDTNQAGQDYFNLSVSPLGFAPEQIYLRAEKMYEAVSSGARDVARDQAVPEEQQ